MLFVFTRVRVLWEERGASMVEYALLVTLIAVVALLAVTFAGEELSDSFSNIANEVEKAGG